MPMAHAAPAAAAAPNAQPTLEPRNPDQLLAPDTLTHGTTGEKLNEWIEAFTVFLKLNY